MKTGLLGSALVLAGCASTIHTTSELGNHSILSIDAKQRVIISGTRFDGQHVICTEPSPDAIVASASYAAATLSNEDDVAAQTAFGRNEQVGSIGLRTETIQLLRDGYFRICEAYLNGALDRRDYDLVILGIDTFMITLVAIQAMGGVVAAPGVILSPQGDVNIGEDGPSVTAGNAADKAAFSQALGMAKSLSKEQVDGIVRLVTHYLNTRPPSTNAIAHLRN